MCGPQSRRNERERENTQFHIFVCAVVRPSVASPISLVRLRSSKHVDSLVKCTEFSLARSSAQVVLPRLIQVALLHKRRRPGDETRYFDFPLDPCLKTL